MFRFEQILRGAVGALRASQGGDLALWPLEARGLGGCPVATADAYSLTRMVTRSSTWRGAHVAAEVGEPRGRRPQRAGRRLHRRRRLLERFLQVLFERAWLGGFLSSCRQP